MWLGTCDLTWYNGKCISLRSETNSAVEQLTTNFEEIGNLLQQYPGCKLTFLELPVYSIFEYNYKKGHRDPNQFKTQDETLIRQVHMVNSQIRRINSKLEKRAPNFCQDLSHNKVKTTKNQHIRLRDRFNFTLYRDGEHPSTIQAKVWLRKLCIKIGDECWSN